MKTVDVTDLHDLASILALVIHAAIKGSFRANDNDNKGSNGKHSIGRI
jgi:hypothetical protein